MARLGFEDVAVELARRQARRHGLAHNTQMMLVAAGIAAFGIVGVAATMMTTLL